MYTLYQLAMPACNLTKITDGDSLGKLRKRMNGMKSASKSNMYCIYRGTTLMTSMMNK